jgi:hypothetical protein
VVVFREGPGVEGTVAADAECDAGWGEEVMLLRQVQTSSMIMCVGQAESWEERIGADNVYRASR